MANVNLPPQAYTRETLTQAFEWLHQQPASLRETAGSIDAMVAMFLQAKRRGQHASADSASVQSFKKDLRHLAEDLKKFETPAAIEEAPLQHNFSMAAFQQQAQHIGQPYPQQPAQAPIQQMAPQVPPIYQQPVTQQPQAPVPHAAPHNGYSSMMTGVGSASFANPTQAVAPPQSIGSNVGIFDSKTTDALEMVREAFNLSSDAEALRMLVSLGFEQIRQILPKT